MLWTQLLQSVVHAILLQGGRLTVSLSISNYNTMMIVTCTVTVRVDADMHLEQVHAVCKITTNNNDVYLFLDVLEHMDIVCIFVCVK